MIGEQYLAIVGAIIGFAVFASLAAVEVKHWHWRRRCDAIDYDKPYLGR